LSRQDKILLLILCLLAVVVWMAQAFFLEKPAGEGMLELQVSAPQATELNNVSWQELLAADGEKTWQIHGAQGILTVKYLHGQGIAVVESSCPDQICVQTGYINKAGQSIVCVPNQVILQLRLQEDAGGKGDIDAILR